MLRDEAADSFAAFVAGRSRALLRLGFLLTADHHRAEDLVQTALMKAARVWTRIEADPEAYVRRILYNESASWHRRRRFRETSLEHVAETAGDSADVDTRVAVLGALRQLTAKQRTVIVLRYFEDLTEVQTAAVLGIGVGTVKSQSRDALARLRTLAPHLEELIRVGGDDE